mmetsp:Transcript_32641/g.88434  ORF Transcript_32641/g.88434 Transcript_32641/m.88434 type:complete len:216 (+) Transcript_32641:742-1389(+)
MPEQVEDGRAQGWSHGTLVVGDRADWALEQCVIARRARDALLVAIEAGGDENHRSVIWKDLVQLQPREHDAVPRVRGARAGEVVDDGRARPLGRGEVGEVDLYYIVFEGELLEGGPLLEQLMQGEDDQLQHRVRKEGWRGHRLPQDRHPRDEVAQRGRRPADNSRHESLESKFGSNLPRRGPEPDDDAGREDRPEAPWHEGLRDGNEGGRHAFWS